MPTLITVAPTGAETSKKKAPSLPVTLPELLDCARACEALGAAMIHVHLRDADGQPTLDLPLLKDAVAALREQTSLIVQLSTGGSTEDSLEDRLRVLEAEPDSCSLSLGTLNFGEALFHNPPGFVRDLYVEAQHRGIVPEFELFDIGHIEAMRRLLDQHGLPSGNAVHCDFVTGVPGGMPGQPNILAMGVQLLPQEVTSWSATGVGRTSIGITLAAIALGGHVRVGMEDTLTFTSTERVRNNEQLVGRAADLSRLADRPPMTTSEARQLLGVSVSEEVSSCLSRRP